MSDGNVQNMSMLELFKMEVESQANVLSDGLLNLEQDPADTTEIESMMRAAHSIKGAARMVGVDSAVKIAHVMEDCFVSAQEGTIVFSREHIDYLLKGVDTIKEISELSEDNAEQWLNQHQFDLSQLEADILTIQQGGIPASATVDVITDAMADPRLEPASQPTPLPISKPAPKKAEYLPPTPIPETRDTSAQNSELADFSMLQLFQIEVEGQAKKLTEFLLALEQSTDLEESLESLMRASHSIKGAARMVGLEAAVKIAHVMEDCFVKAQEGLLTIKPEDVDILLNGVDIIVQISELNGNNTNQWLSDNQQYIRDLENKIVDIRHSTTNTTSIETSVQISPPSQSFSQPAPIKSTSVNQIKTTDVADLSMLQLFRIEVEEQGKKLNKYLLQLEQNTENDNALESLMRAAHSIKGAARMVGVDAVVQIAHVMEDIFVKAQESTIAIKTNQIDTLLKGADTINKIAEQDDANFNEWINQNKHHIEILISEISTIQQGDSQPEISTPEPTEVAALTQVAAPVISVKAQDQSPTEPIASKPAPTNFSADLSMIELLRVEAESQAQILTDGLLALESDPSNLEEIEKMMRAAHSVKGAARMVGLDPIVTIAHSLEDCFVAGQKGELIIQQAHIDLFLSGVDLLNTIVHLQGEAGSKWLKDNYSSLDNFVNNCNNIILSHGSATPTVKTISPAPIPVTPKPAAAPQKHAPVTASATATEAKAPPVTKARKSSTTIKPVKKEDLLKRKPKSTNDKKQNESKKPAQNTKDAAIRVSASSLNRLMGLAGESMVESRWIRPFADSLLTLKRRQVDLIGSLDVLRDAIESIDIDDQSGGIMKETQQKAASCREVLTNHISELESYDRRVTNLADRLNREVITSRMRPFSDGVQGFQRMVRDVARSLGKQVKLEIEGLSTQVDRDILEKIEAPLNHLLRNSVDHGIEMPNDREAEGKPSQGTIKLQAGHSSGMLTILIEDDGKGVNTERLREKIIEKNMTTTDMALNMTDAELMEFLFLPSFSTRDQVTEISGRGVGLDVVHSVVQEMRGVVRATSELGKGTRFHMQLPLTLSVIRALLVEISGEPYAVPLARIDQTLKIERDDIETLEGRQYFTLGSQHIGIVSAHQVLDLDAPPTSEGQIQLIILGERLNRYGLLVERFLGERDLVVQVLDARLGKIKNIAAAAILDDGTPTLIIDVDDLLRSVDVIISKDRVDNVSKVGEDGHHEIKRILVVDDSITVREVERNLLEAQGYVVDVAVDGMDGWNAARMSNFDLIISDVDMPRMNGFEFVSMLKRDPRLKATPVMIVSYKDREEDRIRGLEAGADYYLTKGSFHDDTLMNAVEDLIGKA